MTVPGSYVPKACAYVTRKDCSQLLVFRSEEHDSLQIPKGTIEPGESPVDAVRREVREESGLDLSTPVRRVTADVWTRRTDPLKKYVRFFYHLEAHDAPDEWTHVVDCDGPECGLRFRCFWIDLPSTRDFALSLGDYLDELVDVHADSMSVVAAV